MRQYRIGIDGNEANVINRVGSNHYAFGIIKAIYNFHPQNTQFTIYLKNPPLKDMPLANEWWHYKVISPSFAWTQWRLPLDLYTSLPKPDIFYSPGHYAPRFAPMPTVVSIMDLAFLKMPQLFLRYKRGTSQLASWTEYSIRQAKAVIAISEHTKKDIHESYHIKSDSIKVAYPGVDQIFYTPQSVKHIRQVQKKYSLPDKYLLHLGTLQPRKNIVRLIQAFEQLPSKYRLYSLVLAGQPGWLTEDINRCINQSKVANKIIKTGFVDENDVPALISGAACLCMVGLFEGFGMPPAEALACGTIPVVSNNSSLPEVVGESGITVDPYSTASIVHGIIAALELTKAHKTTRLAMGLSHIKKFNWTNSARIILKTLYDNVT